MESAKVASVEPATRAEVAAILREQNQSFGGDAAALANIDRFAGGAVAVVTGQQVGLFTGPAYAIYKALGAVAMARWLTGQGINAVPVFWMATEDHDLAEVNHCTFISAKGVSAKGQTQRFDLPDGEGASVGAIALGPTISHVVRQAAASLEGADAESVADALRAAYTPDANYGLAFARLMARLLAGHGLILLDPLDARLHRLAQPLYSRAIEHSDACISALLARNKELEGAGFHAQVKVTSTSTLLFLRRDAKRLPIRRKNDAFVASAKSFSRDELLALAAREPESFSANALFRPVVQDALLPTAAYLGGPAEIAYLAQSGVLYDQLGVRRPVVLPRPSFTLIEPYIARLMKKYGLVVEDWFAGRQHVLRKMEAAFLPQKVEHRFAGGEKALRATLEKLRDPLGALDPTLLGALDNATKKISYQHAKLRARAARAAAFRKGVIERHEAALTASLFPHHAPQERTACLAPFLARHGSGLLDELLSRIAPDTLSQHHVLSL